MNNRFERNESTLFEPSAHRLVTALGYCIAAIAVFTLFWLAADVTGVLVAFAAVGVWLVLGAPYAIATGAIAIAALTPESQIVAVLAGVAFLVFLVASTPASPIPGRYALSVLLGFVCFAPLALVLPQMIGYWQAAALLVIGIALVAYSLYRYHLYRLGLLDDTESKSNESTPVSETQTKTSKTESSPAQRKDNSRVETTTENT